MNPSSSFSSYQQFASLLSSIPVLAGDRWEGCIILKQMPDIIVFQQVLQYVSLTDKNNKKTPLYLYLILENFMKSYKKTWRFSVGDYLCLFLISFVGFHKRTIHFYLSASIIIISKATIQWPHDMPDSVFYVLGWT